jgi:hypothetical protein
MKPITILRKQAKLGDGKFPARNGVYVFVAKPAVPVVFYPSVWAGSKTFEMMPCK